MAISEGGEGMVMPVTPIGGYGNAGFGGDGAWWLLILFALFMGNGFGGYGYGGGAGLRACLLHGGRNLVLDFYTLKAGISRKDILWQL